ncbi:MAG: CoA ester lyase [Chromatiales bacterium]|nr:CoA ester lyase [Chromatiales bacterium]
MNRIAPARPRRSALFVPGSNPRALQKAPQLSADAVILDLEDAVLPTAKVTARTEVLAAVARRPFGTREVVIRINGLDTEWGIADLRAAATSGADGILLPKVDTPATLLAAARVLDELAAPPGLRLWSMAETPRGVLDVDDIARCTPRLGVIVMGTADLGKALRVPGQPGRAGLVPALAHCVLAARAAGLDILDGVYMQLTDPAGFRAECVQGRHLGFDGKTLIHPGQLDACNEIFGVSDADAASAAELIAAWETAAATGAGVAVHAGRLVERLHVDDARRQLALHRAIRHHGRPAGPA